MTTSSSSSVVVPAVDDDSNNSTTQFSCPICLEEHGEDTETIQLSCGHRYCVEGLSSFCISHITDAHVHLKCFHLPTLAFESGNLGQQIKELACNEPLSPEEIRSLLKDDASVLAKYDRFTFLQVSLYTTQCCCWWCSWWWYWWWWDVMMWCVRWVCAVYIPAMIVVYCILYYTVFMLPTYLPLY